MHRFETPEVVSETKERSREHKQRRKCESNGTQLTSRIRDPALDRRSILINGSMRRRRGIFYKKCDLHPAVAPAPAVNVIIALGHVEEKEILAAAPVADCVVCCAVIVARLIYLNHVVLIFLVPERDPVKKDEVLTLNPVGVVNVGVPSPVATDNVIRCRHMLNYRQDGQEEPSP